MEIRAVLMDLDDTLVPRLAPFENSLRAVCAEAGRLCRIDPALLFDRVCQYARAMWQAHPSFRLSETLGISSTEALWASFEDCHESLIVFRHWAPRFRNEVWSRALTEHSARNPQLAEHLSTRFVKERRASQTCFPEVRGALESLRRRYRLGIVTNGIFDAQMAKIREVGLLPAFDAVIVAGAVGIGKPDPAVFHLALEELSVACCHAVMVGDDLAKDVKGARTAGVSPVWMNRNSAPRAPNIELDAQISNLSELETVLELMSG